MEEMAMTEVNSSRGAQKAVRALCESLRSHVNLDKLRETKSERGRIECLLENASAMELVKKSVDDVRQSIKNLGSRKNRAVGIKFKEEGNAAFGKKDYQKAVELYTKSICWIPEEDDYRDISIGIANRAAAFFHLGDISSALEDAKLAFAMNYPKELHHKLYERVGRCYLQQGNKNEAKKSFKLAITALESLSLEAEKVNKTQKALEDLIKSCSNLTSSRNSQLAHKEESQLEEPIPDVTGGRSCILKSATSRVSLQQSKSAGRYIVANHDIQPGDVILVQKAYVSCLAPQYYHVQCYHCFKMSVGGVGCKVCATVSFCSRACRDKALSTYHKYECEILEVMAHSGISITCYMALRLILQGNLNQLRTWAQLVNEANMRKDEANCGEGDSKVAATEYKADDTSFFQLVTHSEKRSAEDIFQRSVMSLFLLCLAEEGGFFKDGRGNKVKGGMTADGGERRTGEKIGMDQEGREEGLEERKRALEEDKVNAAIVLLHSLQSLQFNAHEVAGWDPDTSKSVFLGGGLFLTLALFNHSCNPAIVRYFVNDTVVVRAIRTIYKGEEVTENYGPLFTLSSRSERRETLRNQYWFHCECVCCRQDWSTFDNMPAESFTFRCSFCHWSLGKSSEEAPIGLLLQCRRCSRPTNILKSLKSLQASEGRFEEALQLLGKGREKAALGILLENIALFDSILLPPFRDYHMCQQGARKCYIALGNKARTQPCPL